ncbi:MULTISPECIES: sugar ABC transporter ATP-binding protein [unclassified Frankia]|uniref:sugar ABC transporter ATP-binding protein n=1 Tax=unclassified Frankia TaxID=2632575 RepID=UPI00202423B1
MTAVGEAQSPRTTAPAIRVNAVSKTFGGTRALRDVSFEVPRASVHALCGGNGSGKSTLIKILAGVHQADSGTIEIDGHVHDATRTNPGWAGSNGLYFVHQAVGTFPSMTVAENFAVSSAFGARSLAPVSWRALHRRVQKVLERFEIDVSPKTIMAQVPPATRTMIAVARALQYEAEAGRGTLVLDEPTASLPAEEAQAVLDAMRGYARRGHAVVFVSHRLSELLAVSDSATFLRDGQHVRTCDAADLDESSLVQLITGHAPVAPSRNTVGTDQAEVRLRLENLAVGSLDDICLQVRAGEVVGIAGLLGSGRSTLLQSLFGVRPARGGRATLDGVELTANDVPAAIRGGIAYVPEDRAGQAAFAELSVRANLSAPSLRRYWNRVWLRRAAERCDAQSVIERYKIKVDGPEAYFATMSGGNQQKVVLARWLELAPRLLLLDEPTQGVDIGARTAIHQLVRQVAAAGTAVLLVSSDPQELVDACDRVVGVHSGRITGEASGADLTVRRCTELGHGLGAPSGARTPTSRALGPRTPATHPPTSMEPRTS